MFYPWYLQEISLLYVLHRERPMMYINFRERYNIYFVNGHVWNSLHEMNINTKAPTSFAAT